MNLNQGQKIIEREPITMMYYDEIRKFEPIDAVEEKTLLILAQNGDMEARNKLIESQLKFVVAMARRAKTNININDLINEGNIGLIKAINNYDINRDERFASYAVHWINKAINDFIVNNEKIIRVKNANKVYSYVSTYRNKFFKENERWPSDNELREYMSIKGVEFPKTQIFTTAIASIDSINDDCDESLSDNIAREAEVVCSSNNIVGEISKLDNKIIVENILSECTEDERDIVTMMYGIGRHEETINSIARIKNMQPMRVKRIYNKAIEKMKKKIIKKNNKNG